MTYDEYKDLGGLCPEDIFNKCQMEANAYLQKLSVSFDIVYASDDAEKLVLVGLIDMSYQNSESFKNGGGSISSIKVGSYSETRGSFGSTKQGNAEAGGVPSNMYDVVSKYCILYRRRICY